MYLYIHMYIDIYRERMFDVLSIYIYMHAGGMSTQLWQYINYRTYVHAWRLLQW